MAISGRVLPLRLPAPIAWVSVLLVLALQIITAGAGSVSPSAAVPEERIPKNGE